MDFRTRITMTVLLLFASVCPAAVIVVEPTNGQYQTIQRAVDVLQPGDTCVIKAGIYREVIRFSHRGNEENPTVIHGEPGVVLSGLDTIKPEWKPVRTGIYKSHVKTPIRQLFVDGELMTPARWPDMPFEKRWDNATWRAAAKGTQPELMVDPALAESNIDWTGAMAILNVGSFRTFRRRVTNHTRGSDRFSYKLDAAHNESGEHPVGMDRYCLFGLQALDQPGEWFYDTDSSTLYLWPPTGANLNKAIVETRVRNEVFVLDNSQHVMISGLDVRGSVVRFNQCQQCVLQDVHFRYAACIRNPFGKNSKHRSITSPHWSSRKWFGETSVGELIEITGNHNQIRHCSVRFSEGPAMTIAGDDNLIENCLFHDNDWHGLDYGFGLDCLATKSATIRRLTMFNAGGSEGLRLSNHGKSLVELSHLHHLGLRQSDGACVQLSTGGVRGTEVRYNWIHDHNAFHWGGNGLRADDQSRGVQYHHNVIWNCRHKAIVVKGDDHHIHHNTCFRNAEHDILIPRDRLPGKPRELTQQNRNSYVHHNLGRVAGNWIWQPSAVAFAKQESNSTIDINELLDPKHWDFRPKQAMAGAYTANGERWMAGCINAVQFRSKKLILRLPPFAPDELSIDAGKRIIKLKLAPGTRIYPIQNIRHPGPLQLNSLHLGKSQVPEKRSPDQWHSFDRPMLANTAFE